MGEDAKVSTPAEAHVGFQVNDPFTAEGRQRPHRDTRTDFLPMMRRMIRATARRVADGDPEDLAEMLALERTLDAAIAEAVERLHDFHGFTWESIGEAAGITRQGAYQRWGRDKEEA